MKEKTGDLPNNDIDKYFFILDQQREINIMSNDYNHQSNIMKTADTNEILDISNVITTYGVTPSFNYYTKKTYKEILNQQKVLKEKSRIKKINILKLSGNNYDQTTL